MTAAEAIALIALDLPERPTTADVLYALARAEASGFERGYERAQKPGELVFGPLEPDLQDPDKISFQSVCGLHTALQFPSKVR